MYIFRIDFNILLLTFKLRSGVALKYISDLLTPYVPCCDLRASPTDSELTI